MKKLLSTLLCILILNIAFGQNQTYQLFSVTPFTQVERINGQFALTAPIDLQYNIIHSFGTAENWFIGGGAGAGINFNGNNNGQINLNFPITLYVGGEVIPGFPSMAFGGGLNAQTGNLILMINLHFASFQINPASARYKSIAASSDYSRTKIGFRKTE